MNDQEYTKHYYIEGERICSKIGSGFGVAPYDPLGGPVDVLSGDFSELPGQMLTMVQRSAVCAGYEGDITISEELKPAHNMESDPENDQYFYHPDHLGSSSYITDLYGNGIQHLQYLPFGETFVDQQTGQWNTPYKFSGKEKDDETGYSYFGARYYDSELSVWLSVDPMASKYPSLSPYAYCANNPVMLVDPNGESIDDAKKSHVFQRMLLLFPDNNGQVNHGMGDPTIFVDENGGVIVKTNDGSNQVVVIDSKNESKFKAEIKGLIALKQDKDLKKNNDLKNKYGKSLCDWQMTEKNKYQDGNKSYNEGFEAGYSCRYIDDCSVLNDFVIFFAGGTDDGSYMSQGYFAGKRQAEKDIINGKMNVFAPEIKSAPPKIISTK